MRTAYEYVATVCMCVQRNFNFVFSKGGELDWPRDTLKTGYTQAGLTLIIMSHLDLMDWISELQRGEGLFLSLQRKTIRYVSRILGCAGLDSSCDWPAKPILVISLNLCLLLIMTHVQGEYGGDKTDVDNNLGGAQGIDGAPGKVVD